MTKLADVITWLMQSQELGGVVSVYDKQGKIKGLSDLLYALLKIRMAERRGKCTFDADS